MKTLLTKQNLKTVLSSVYLKVIVVLLMIYMFSFNYVSVGECTISKNIFNNNIELDTVSGFKFSAPWILKSNLDTRPRRVCVECDCRNKTCVLISFNPNGYKDFVQREGWNYYWWRNRFSINLGHDSESRGLYDILRSYAFDGNEYSFLEVKSSF